MKLFKCKDGNNRVFSKREVAFDAHTMAVLVLSKFLATEEDYIGKIFSLKNRKQILDAAWDEIFTNGMETPHYRVGDSLGMESDDVVAEVEAFIKTKFIGLD